ncbi:MAG: hypothetical protein ACRDV9_11670 [Acidimicrobiia bacterium]
MYVGVEDGGVVVHDDGMTFGQIVGLRGHADEFGPWSSERASATAAHFSVQLLDEGGPVGDDGERHYEGFRLALQMMPGESLADGVQSVAQAIDGVLAVHTRSDAPSYGAYFWDHDQREATDP